MQTILYGKDLLQNNLCISLVCFPDCCVRKPRQCKNLAEMKTLQPYKPPDNAFADCFLKESLSQPQVSGKGP